MCKFWFPRIHGPDHDLCIRSIRLKKFLKSDVRYRGTGYEFKPPAEFLVRLLEI